MMRVLVCGGRDYADRAKLNEVLDEIGSTVKWDIFIIEGEASGADTLAREWAKSRGMGLGRYPADWNKHGKAAGPIRNKQMLDEGEPDLVVAFPGGRGTANMIEQAERAGVPVRKVEAW